MRVEIGIPDNRNSNETNENQQQQQAYAAPGSSAPHIYLEGLKGYPDVRCQPKINGILTEFRLSLKDVYECGVTRVINKVTVSRVK